MAGLLSEFICKNCNPKIRVALVVFGYSDHNFREIAHVIISPDSDFWDIDNKVTQVLLKKNPENKLDVNCIFVVDTAVPDAT